MKLIALAAALTLASPALAQSTQTTPATADAGTNPTATQLGGYAPPTMWPDGQPKPGDKVVFVPSKLTPSEAFPPPPAQDHYPICKRGQTDGCMQRGRH